MGMKFRCERDTLLSALTVAVRAVASTTSSRAALTGVHLRLDDNTLVVTGSDLDLTLSVTSEVAGDEDGIAVAPARLLADVVRALPQGAIDFDASDAEARLVAGPSKFSIRMIPSLDYPQQVFAGYGDDAEPAFGSPVNLGAAEFRDALAQVVRSASTDDSRPILTGVLMAAENDSGLRLVSTDSYRLSLRDLEGSSILGERQKVLVPSRALGELRRLIPDSEEVTLRLAEHYAQFEVGPVNLTTRLIPGDFPNYNGLIPTDHPNRLTVERENLLEVVKRVRLLAQDSSPVRLTMTEGNLKVSAVTQDVGQANESMPATYDGDDLTIAFNPAYLVDGIEAVTGDEVTLESADAVKPALLRPVGDEQFVYLLMPVRV